MKSVSIMGLGRVGTALALSLPPGEYRIDHLIVRGAPSYSLPENLSSLCVTLESLESIGSDIVFITTRDSEVSQAASQIVGKLRSNTIFHTSGSQPSTILSELATRQRSIGSIHPLVSISDPQLGAERFRGAFFCVEGDHNAVALGTRVVEDLGGRPFSIDTNFKILYHAAAVTACGHIVALLDASFEMMAKTGLSRERSKEILLPLIASTVENVARQTTSEALTGTFARADTETFTRHIGALNQYGSEELMEIYLLLAERSLELAARQGVSAERIEKLRTKVAVAKSKLKW